MKAIYLILAVFVLFSLFFGCIQTDTNNVSDSNVPKVNTHEEVDATKSDVGTDISGINTTLNEIDSSLS